MSAIEPPRPALRGEEELFYQRLGQHELVFQRCRGCSAVVFYLRAICPQCHGASLDLAVSSARGTLHSFTTQYRPGHPYYKDSVPYSIGLIDVDEGFRVLAGIEGMEPADLRIGMPVQLEFVDIDEHLTVLSARESGTTERARE